MSFRVAKALAVALVAMAAAVAFECLKRAIASPLSVESSGLTILFFALSAFLLTLFLQRRESSLWTCQDEAAASSQAINADLKRSELELRRLNRALSALSRCNEALMRASDEAQLLHQVCDIVVQVGGYTLAWVGYVRHDAAKAVQPMAKSGFDDGYIEQAQVTWDDTERGQGPLGKAIRTGEVCVLRNVVDSPLFAPWREIARRHGFTSIISLPLKDGEERIGALAIYSYEADAFDSREVELLKELAAQLTYGIKTLRNQAEHRRADEAVRRSEAKLRAFVEQSPFGIFQTHLAENRFLEVNPALVKMMGYDSAEEMLTKKLTTDIYLTPGERDKTWEQLRRDGFNDVRVWCKRKDGTPLMLHLTGRLIQDPITGDRIFEGIVEDVTKRVAAKRALRESEERFRHVVESAPLGIYIQTDGLYRYLNPACLTLFGATSADQMIGQPFLDRIHPDTRPAVIERAKMVAEGGLPVPFLEEKLLRLDGSIFDGEVTAIPFNVSGRKGALVFVRDITERKQQEQKRRNLEQQLLQSQKMEAVGRLAGGVAHDFNNLLMVIRSYTEILEDGLSSSAGLRNYTWEIMKATQRAASLTRQLLAFSRKQIVAPVALDLNAAIEDTAKMLMRLIGADIDLEVNLGEALWPIQADPDQIAQILMNLCVNARDAMPQGGTITITTSKMTVGESGEQSSLSEPILGAPSQPGEYVKLCVSDTGMGMGTDVMGKIFEPFFTTKEAGKGTGLGLAMVYGIVEQNQGCIWVESAPGMGACFTIYLPRAEKNAALPAPGSRSQAPKQGNETVLIAEDEEQLREAIRGYLSNLGYKVLEASSGPQALSIAEAHEGRIDLLLTDVVMPKMSGRELSHVLAARRPEMTTIYMSGYTGDEPLRHGIEEMSTIFLQKPFNLSALASTVRTALESRA